MSTKNFIKLILLSAIWGSSFIFMRIVAPAIGPISTSFSRLFIAGIFFIVYFKLTTTETKLKDNIIIIAMIALINTALPFTFYSIAALYIPAGISSIINSMAPMFGMLFTILLLKEKPSLRGLMGIVMGIIGVALITGGGAITLSFNSFYGIFASLLGAMCYGLASVIIKKHAAHVPAMTLAGYSPLIASIYLIPLLPFQNTDIKINFTVALSVLTLALLCSALAYLIYYNLVAEIGPTKTLTVTFLMPIFSIIWGILILKETAHPMTLVGMIIVLLGTRLVLTHH